MKRLGKEEFINRVNEVAKAMKIFIPAITDNVNIAFDIYQRVLADDDKQMAIMISKRDKAGQHINPLLRDLHGPACPECGNQYMTLHGDSVDVDGIKWKSAWECTKCLSIFYSEKTAADWMNELGVREDEVKNDSNPKRK